MESDPREGESSEAQLLRDVDAIRARTAPLAPRGHALLQVAYTVFLAAYMGVFAFAGSNEAGASSFGGLTFVLIFPPLLVSSGLFNGANERFRTRLRDPSRRPLSLGFFFVVLAALLIWGLAGGRYPWWVALITAGLTFVSFGIRPLRVVLRARASTDETLTPQPLPVPARVTTILIGVYLAAVCATALSLTVASLVMVLGMVAVIVAVSAQAAPWGLLRTGYEWRVPQWTAFGIAALVMFLLAVLIIATDIVTPVVAVGAGALVAVCLSGAAFIPGRSRGTSAA